MCASLYSCLLTRCTHYCGSHRLLRESPASGEQLLPALHNSGDQNSDHLAWVQLQIDEWPCNLSVINSEPGGGPSAALVVVNILVDEIAVVDGTVPSLSERLRNNLRMNSLVRRVAIVREHCPLRVPWSMRCTKSHQISSRCAVGAPVGYLAALLLAPRGIVMGGARAAARLGHGGDAWLRGRCGTCGEWLPG